MNTGPLAPERVRELRKITELWVRFRTLSLVVVSGAGIGGLLAGVLVAVGPSAIRHSDVATAQEPQVLAVGQVCRVEFDIPTIESCGNAGFGDLRLNCTETEVGRCPATTAITLENIGDDEVTVESDSGTSGHVVTTRHPPIRPGATVTVVPRTRGDLIFDIDVDAKAHSTEELRVIDIV
ncbi:hypothetical protein ACSHXN_10305 [Streptomyces sp. HUAS TT11]|uniref:hypothetical protein n=1 Tax=Streptomyces sp. HUAS TT11 TaxID=3447508 RepID=UPI003F659769